MNRLTHILIERLKNKGMEPNTIPGFIRNLANTILAHPHTNFSQLNKEMHFLGWDDFELDYRTLELARACFEAEGLKNFGKKLARWFQIDFRPDNDAVNGYPENQRPFLPEHMSDSGMDL